MTLIILGIIVFIIGLAMGRSKKLLNVLLHPLAPSAFLLALLGVLLACIVQIEAGEIGVKKLFGKVQDDVLTSGLHFINPLLEVEKMDVKTQNYTMSGVHDEGHQTG